MSIIFDSTSATERSVLSRQGAKLAPLLAKGESLHSCIIKVLAWALRPHWSDGCLPALDSIHHFVEEHVHSLHIQPAECEEPSAALDPLVNSVDRCEPVHKVLAVIVVPLQSPTRMAQHAAFGTATEIRLVPRQTHLRLLLLLLLVFLTRKPVLFTQRSELILLDTRGAVDPCKCKLGGSARRDWSGCGGARLRHSRGTDRRPSAALSAP